MFRSRDTQRAVGERIYEASSEAEMLRLCWGGNSSRPWASALVVLALALLFLQPAHAARIKDIAQVDGARENQLIGFGLVGGLAATGDDPKSAPYTAEAIANLLGSQGFQVDPALIKVKNFAAVMVTADIPAYVSGGERMDVTISAIGSAKSLANGVLYQTLLKGADGKVYAVAQGQVSLGTASGASAGAGGAAKQALTVGRIPDGAIIEAEVPATIIDMNAVLRLNLAQPDFTTASNMASAINAKVGAGSAWAEDGGTVAVQVPEASRVRLVDFISAIERIEVEASSPAKLVINQRTGTIVMGADVSILPVSVTHGSMSLTFGEQLSAAWEEPATEGGSPPPISMPDGSTSPSAVLLPEEWKLAPTTAQRAAEGLGRLKLSAAELVAIFEAIDAAGALLGRLEVI